MSDPNWALRILVDDHPSPGLEAEHGFSLWLEGDGRRILFDTGASDLFIRNAGILGLDLSSIDAVVLSHGHYDHTGGLSDALHLCQHADVYLHPDAVQPRWRRLAAPPHKPIGMPSKSKSALETAPPELIHRSSIARPLTPRLYLSGEVSRSRDGAPGGPLFIDEACTRPDPFEDEQFLLLKGREGWSLISGCGHPGLPNMLHHASLLTRGEPIDSILGGFHLSNAPKEVMTSALSALREHKVRRVFPGHCTGADAIQNLQEFFGNDVQALHTGLLLDL